MQKKHLNEAELLQLTKLTAKIEHGRVREGKEMLNCVVVEKDWPMYEDTWDAIEQFCSKKAGPSSSASRRGKLETFEVGVLFLYPFSQSLSFGWGIQPIYV